MSKNLINRLNEAGQAMQASLKGANKDHAVLRSQVTDLTHENGILRSNLTNTTAVLANVTALKDELSSNLTNTTAVLANVTALNDELSTNLTNANAVLVNVTAVKEELEGNLTSVSILKEISEQNLETVTAEKEVLEKDLEGIATLYVELTANFTNVTELKDELSSNLTSVTALNGELTANLTNSTRLVAKYVVRKELLEGKIANITEVLANVTATDTLEHCKTLSTLIELESKTAEFLCISQGKGISNDTGILSIDMGPHVYCVAQYLLGETTNDTFTSLGCNDLI